MLIPFFLSAPRTRSSALFEMIDPYFREKHGFKSIVGHTEYFLMRSVLAEFHDAPLGNIETEFKPFDKPAICKTKACVSSADSKIPERKILI